MKPSPCQACSRRERDNLSPSLPAGPVRFLTLLCRGSFSRKTSLPRAVAPSLSGSSGGRGASGHGAGGIFLRPALTYGTPGGMERRPLHRGATDEGRGEGLSECVMRHPLRWVFARKFFCKRAAGIAQPAGTPPRQAPSLRRASGPFQPPAPAGGILSYEC